MAVVVAAAEAAEGEAGVTKDFLFQQKIQREMAHHLQMSVQWSSPASKTRVTTLQTEKGTNRENVSTIIMRFNICRPESMQFFYTQIALVRLTTSISTGTKSMCKYEEQYTAKN